MVEDKDIKPEQAKGDSTQPDAEPQQEEAQGEQAAGKSRGQPSAGAGTKSQQPPLLKEPAAPAATKKQSRGPVWLALLLALGGLAAAGYTYWQLYQYQETDLANAKSSEQRAFDRIENRAASLEEGLSEHRGEMRKQQQSITELRDRIAAARRQIGEITHVSRKSWMLAEAEYLLRLANQRLVMEQETAGALALLRSADQILLETDDINLHQVRAEIAKEIAALRAVGELDVEGAFLALAALADRLTELPLLSPRSETTPSDADAGDSFASALAKLEKLVTVRRREQPVAPLLPPEQHYYVQQNLRLMLEQAQLALLQRKPLLFSQSLAKAEQWVQSYFELNSSSAALLEALADLKALQVAPELPNISGSLELLKQYLSSPDAQLDNAVGAAGAQR